MLALTALLVPPLLAWQEPTDEEKAANRAKLEDWRKHPRLMAQMQRDLRAFLGLPKERRDQILKLDGDLKQELLAARLWNVLERYHDWLDRLKPEDRQFIDQLKDPEARFAAIQEFRDREWMERQPHVLRAKWEKLQGAARSSFALKLRQEERDRRHEWQVAARFWKDFADGKPMPVRLADLDDPKDRENVTQYLLPMLKSEDKEELAKAEGKWPDYMVTLVYMADRYALALNAGQGPMHFSELPDAVRTIIVPGLPKAAKVAPLAFENPLRPAEGKKWPALAMAVVSEIQKKKTALPHELWAYNEKCLLPPMRAYLQELVKVLTDKEKRDLATAEGMWPQYPEMIETLALRYRMPAPWHTILQEDRWNNYRTLRQGDRPEIVWVYTRQDNLKTSADERKRLQDEFFEDFQKMGTNIFEILPQSALNRAQGEAKKTVRPDWLDKKHRK
jgi:hypothetical protein